jgi:hypothetical protein
MTREEPFKAALRQLITLGYLPPQGTVARGMVETYQDDLDAGGLVVWNVTLAKLFVAQGKSLGLVEVPRSDLYGPRTDGDPHLRTKNGRRSAGRP